MHCTSPGTINGKCEIKNSLNLLQNSLRNIEKIEENLIFDDTKDDIDEWSSPAHIPQSRSWFCCSNEKSNDFEQPPLRARPLSCRYSIVRTEPTSQSDIVNIIILSKKCVIYIRFSHHF